MMVRDPGLLGLVYSYIFPDPVDATSGELLPERDVESDDDETVRLSDACVCKLDYIAVQEGYCTGCQQSVDNMTRHMAVALRRAHGAAMPSERTVYEDLVRIDEWARAHRVSLPTYAMQYYSMLPVIVGSNPHYDWTRYGMRFSMSVALSTLQNKWRAGN